VGQRVRSWQKREWTTRLNGGPHPKVVPGQPVVWRLPLQSGRKPWKTAIFLASALVQIRPLAPKTAFSLAGTTRLTRLTALNTGRVYLAL